MFDPVEQRRKAAIAALVVIPIIVLVSDLDAGNGRQFGVEGHAPLVVNVILLGAQGNGDDAALKFGFLGIVERIAQLDFVSLGNGMVYFEADLVAVIGVVFRAGLVKTQVVHVTESDQGLVEGDVDRERRAEFDSPTLLLGRPE